MINFIVAPDYSPEHFSGWHLLNTYLQKKTSISSHITLCSSLSEQKQLIDSEKVDLIYANPFDAALLIKEKGFRPIIRPKNYYDEMVIITSNNSTFSKIEDIKNFANIVSTNNYDIRLIGMRLLEPADIDDSNSQFYESVNYQSTVRQVINNQNYIGFLMVSSFDKLSNITKSQIKVLVKSSISDIHHLFLVSPQFKEFDLLQNSFLTIDNLDILNGIDLKNGFEKYSDEQAYFMIDLMNTLMD